VLDDVIDAMRDENGPMTATTLADRTKRGRGNIVKLLQDRADIFVRVGKDPKDSRGILYGLIGRGGDGAMI
jgi:hypothetical protein